MRYQLSLHSPILVCGLQGQGMTHIAEMPERGQFMPDYGMIGGSFMFVFHPMSESVEITVETSASEHPLLHSEPIEPLKLTVPDALLTQAEVIQNIGFVAPDDVLTYSPEFLFGFYGEFLEMFRKWEKYSKDMGMYDFSFTLTSIGTMMVVSHRESKSLLDLTRDVNW